MSNLGGLNTTYKMHFKIRQPYLKEMNYWYHLKRIYCESAEACSGHPKLLFLVKCEALKDVLSALWFLGAEVTFSD